MPPDIRSFFGGKPQATPPATATKKDDSKAKTSSKKGRKKAVVSDSDSDEEVVEVKKSTPKKSVPTRTKPSPAKATATTASAYFGDSKKSKKADPPRHKVEITPAKTTPKSKGANGAANKKSKTNSKRTHDDDDFEDVDNDDDLFAADFKKNGSKGDDYEESDSDVEIVKPKRSSARQPLKAKQEQDIEMEDDDDDDDFTVPDDEDEKPKSKKTTRAKKRKSEELDGEDEDEEDEPPKKGRGRAASNKSTPGKAKAPAKRAKKDAPEEDSQMKAIFDSIPTVRPPTPPPKDPDQKWNPFQHKNNAAAPANAGAKEIPEGEDNCLAGLSFVFTGLLETLPREEGIALVKRYGGKVMTAPSSKTSYVVLGADAGPSKLRKIKDHGLRTIEEDGLFELIRRLPANGGSGNAAQAAQARADKEADLAREQALEMEKKEREEQKARQKQAAAIKKDSSAPGKAPVPPKIPESSKLWTVKYAPTSMSQIVGNKTQVEKLQKWLKTFQSNAKLGFKRAGADGSGIYRSIIISGPPGIGKTTAAHLVAKMEGYDIVESNASDTRSKKLVEDGLKGVLSNTSLLGYFSGDGKAVHGQNRKLVLIMDEVDGMSAGDRGGVGAMAAICKKTAIPIILICNDRRLPKMKSFDNVAYDLKFARPTTDQIRGRMMTIAFREKLQLPTAVLNALIEGTGADIRQIVNMISTVKLDEADMDFSRGKDMSKAWQKHVVMKPWDITGKILGGGMFAQSSKATLNDKVELYFNDHELSYLFIQENYLSTNPILLANSNGPDRKMKLLELVEKAADSISDGDLIDRMIHGSQQQWSLMPTHGMFSFVRPASFISGSMGYSQGGTRFPSWLGNNSKTGKNARTLKEIQGHMRLRSSADRHEIRKEFVPMLWNMMPKRLMKEGKESAPDVINFMDSYFLTKDDFDNLQELGVGEMAADKIKIESQAKAAFTRLYNSQSHPMPFMKASQVFAPKKMAKVKPDLEEALDDSDEGEAVEDNKAEEEEENDIKKDKYIKAPKKKPAPKASKKRGAADSDDESSAPKKSKASVSEGKGKAKK